MPYNIVFYFTDQQRWDTCGCFGQPLDITPNLDKLATEGVKFDNAFSPQPVCGPCRALFQTGRYPTETGCFRNNIMLPPDVKTLGQYIEEAGYETAYIGKWHLASDGELEKPPVIDHTVTAIPRELRGGYTGYWRTADVLEFTSHGYDGFVFDENDNKIEFKGYRADCINDLALQSQVVDAVGPVALELYLVVVLVEDEAVIAVGGELQHVGGAPVAGIAAPQLPGDGGDSVVYHRGLFQLPVAGQVPLADIGGLIARLLYVLAQGLHVGGQHDIVAEAPRLRGIAAGLEQGPAGAAHRLGGEGVVELHALRGQLIQVGGDVQRLAEAAAGVPALLVGEVKYDIVRHVIPPWKPMRRALFSP